MNDLSERNCVACRGDSPTPSEESVLEYLKLVVGWHRQDNSIEREFAFTNFKKALEFFNAVAALAEEENHHPDMSIHNWKIVKLALTTHAVHGLTDNDFIMAAKIDRLKNLREEHTELHYYNSLPRKRMGSGVLIRNSKGEILVLKTTYKEHWEIPGGAVEKNESPKQAAERETLEEIGLRLNLTACLVIHYRSTEDKQDENIMFVFNGGTVKDGTKLHLDGKEIAEARFVSFEDAVPLVGERIASRLPYCEQALKEKRTIYLEGVDGLNPTFVS